MPPVMFIGGAGTQKQLEGITVHRSLLGETGLKGECILTERLSMEK